VIAFFLFGLGWPLLIDLVFSPMFRGQPASWVQPNRALREFLTALSPMVGPMSAIRMLQSFEFERRGPIWISIGIAILTKAVMGGILLWLTIKTFDCSLGRVPESQSRARRRKSGIREEPVPSATSLSGGLWHEMFRNLNLTRSR
jgi:hypothetical protein